MAVLAPMAPIKQPGDDLLAMSIRRIGLATATDQLFARWPALREVTDRLARYLSDVPLNCTSGRAIIDIAIEQALTHAYAGANPNATVYLQRLINAATMVLRYEIRDGNDVWNPVASPSLAHWFTHHASATVTASPKTVTEYRIADYRHYLASRLVTTRDLVAIGACIDDVAAAPN